MKILLFICALFCTTAVWASDTLYVTDAEGAQPRTGAMVTHLRALATAMQQLQTGQHLQLLYPGGDAGSLWAHELRAWLVALGLSSQRIELLPGSSREDAIEVRVAGSPAAKN